MDIFDILGPVMVGPSSSHTAGAARIGKMARTLLGGEPMEAKIHLHGCVETETGLQYTFNETVALRVNYYLERGFNMDDSRNNGEFSTQEIRAYLLLTLGNHSVTPYTRIGLDRWSNWDWQDDIEREGHDFNRVGLFYGYDFQNGLSVSLEYAFEWQDHDEGDSDKFHYAGVGVNYSF